MILFEYVSRYFFGFVGLGGGEKIDVDGLDVARQPR